MAGLSTPSMVYFDLLNYQLKSRDKQINFELLSLPSTTHKLWKASPSCLHFTLLSIIVMMTNTWHQQTETDKKDQKPTNITCWPCRVKHPCFLLVDRELSFELHSSRIIEPQRRHVCPKFPYGPDTMKCIWNLSYRLLSCLSSDLNKINNHYRFN